MPSVESNPGALLKRMVGIINSGLNGAGEHNLLPWQHRMTLEQVQDSCDLGLKAVAANKRLIGLLPLPRKSSMHEILWSENVDPVQVLATAEVKRFSGVLRAISEKEKFRAAMLFFKGRVIGCLYTELPSNRILFDEQARITFLQAMYRPFTILNAYRLQPDLALAAGALFYDTAKRTQESNATPQIILEAITSIFENFETGCMTINNDEGSFCTVYFRLGEIIAVYSFKEGWLTPDIDAVEHCLASEDGFGIFISTVPSMREEEFDQFCIRPAAITFKSFNKQRKTAAENIEAQVMDELVTSFPPMDDEWRRFVSPKES